MQRRTHARGFTLIEVLIVIAIVLALSAVVSVAVLGRRDQAQEDLTLYKIRTIESAMKQFRFDHNRYPSEEEGVSVLWNAESLDPDADASRYPSEGYLEDPQPEDEWGSQWGYRFPSIRGDESEYDLWSFGPNGEDEQGEGDDIVSWRQDEDDEFGGGDMMPPPPSGG